jgi:hypothetical protein
MKPERIRVSPSAMGARPQPRDITDVNTMHVHERALNQSHDILGFSLMQFLWNTRAVSVCPPIYTERIYKGRNIKACPILNLISLSHFLEFFHSFSLKRFHVCRISHFLFVDYLTMPLKR